MSKEAHILYKVYYDEKIVYLGRTNQSLENRLRGHFLKKPMHRVLDPRNVSSIEYATFNTVADMYVYEIYYINKLKPPLNRDDKARDELTVELPEVDWTPYVPRNMDKWIERITEDERLEKERRSRMLDSFREGRARRDRHSFF